MKDVVLDEVVKEIFINEKVYQQIKNKMCKADDYFNVIQWKEMKNIQAKFRRNL